MRKVVKIKETDTGPWLLYPTPWGLADYWVNLDSRVKREEFVDAGGRTVREGMVKFREITMNGKKNCYTTCRMANRSSNELHFPQREIILNNTLQLYCSDTCDKVMCHTTTHIYPSVKEAIAKVENLKNSAMLQKKLGDGVIISGHFWKILSHAEFDILVNTE